MKITGKQVLLLYGAALLLGVACHGLFGLRPCLLTAIFSPVRESIWEHMKLLYHPLLWTAWRLGKRDQSVFAVRLYAMVASCLLLLPAGYVLRCVLQVESLAADLALYGVLMAAGFLLPRLLWPLGDRPAAGKLAVPLAAALWVLLVWFSLDPPEGVLFAGGEAVRTFFRIPV